MGATRRLNDQDKGEFIAALKLGLSMEAAAKLAGRNRKTFYVARKNDPEFDAEVQDALEAGTDVLEDEATRRAKEGVLEPVFYKGEIVGQVRKYSDTLLIFMLKARRPEKYRERYEVKHKDDEDLAGRIAAGRQRLLEARSEGTLSADSDILN